MEIIVALAILVALTGAIGFAERAVSRVRIKSHHRSRAAFPAPLPREHQWQRTTSIVERSIGRAADIVAANGAAARQLEAAEYALHCLLDEIGSVMNTNVSSPLLAKTVSVDRRHHRPSTALAA